MFEVGSKFVPNSSMGFSFIVSQYSSITLNCFVFLEIKYAIFRVFAFLGFKFEMHGFIKFGDPDWIFSTANGGTDDSRKFFSSTFDHQIVPWTIRYCYPESVTVLFSLELEAF